MFVSSGYNSKRRRGIEPRKAQQ